MQALLTLSSAAPKTAYMCSQEGYTWLCLDRKMLVMMFLVWVVRRKTIFTASTGKI